MGRYTKGSGRRPTIETRFMTDQRFRPVYSSSFALESVGAS
jgi:hypothetical protein